MRRFPLLVTLLAVCTTSTDADAETYRFIPTTFYTTLSAAHAPALRIASGDRVITTTVDDRGQGGNDRTVATGSRPQTGPFYVEGAEPGDLLVVTIERLEPNRTTGTSAAAIVPAVAGAVFTSGADAPRVPWTIDKIAGTVRFDLNAAGRASWRERFVAPVLELPLRPTLASIGVAPASAGAPAGAAGPFGGELGSAGVAAGTRVMLPVFHTGALLFLGHGHARQGDGAIGGTGVETSLDVEFTVAVVKQREWPHSSGVRPSTVVGEFPMLWPRLESAELLMTVGSGSTLLEALQHATVELHHWLDDDFGLNERAVHVFLGQAIEYEVARVTDGQFTVAARVRKSYLPRAIDEPRGR